jgi:hypothetical protein
MAVPILIFLIALTAGVLLAARWLPDLDDGPPTSPIVIWATAVLVGIALALLAVHAYETIRQLGSANAGAIGNADPDIVATGIIDTLRDSGTILALSAVVYLLAPRGARYARAGGSA